MATTKQYTMETFSQLESEVRSYSRSFPAVFERAKGYSIWDSMGKEYIDFFSGAGALNYGHNNEKMKQSLIDYIQKDGILHSLDMGTVARGEFLEKFNDIILRPRHLEYKVMFPGPTGTNAVESALKIARKVSGRTNVISFSHAFHGMTIGALSLSGNALKRKGAGIPLSNVTIMPYDNYVNGQNTIDYLKRFLLDNGSGVDFPAAIILETVQGEGGLNVASASWLKAIEELCRENGILLIVDDIQGGCGRTGTFFSFEPAEIQPDIVCLSKSIGGIGLPMALTLIKPEYDQWLPGEHNGTFRGNNLAFVAATEALDYWVDDCFSFEIQEKAEMIKQELTRIIETYPLLDGELRGRGLMQGIACKREGIAKTITKAAFDQGLIIETSGPHDEVIKLLPPLIIDQDGIQKGMAILEKSIQAVLRNGM
ncbi:diaminobutyrate-2-oxoglutarate transaminase [Pullulanibacillus pueri]|uniref:Diaminobutyrate--2-oxoglutarate transaminase n=1 Tax=Pullulanibacillus pueri TaxID=1437324 RepID=A0A8J2ZTM4_9BACL|nr:diaminobutyrate--2-oxoglutarate transaminase [Pullulanibacillus pueri]MBM7680261.1 diaminobutyrate-2-oxoglutarate transaminase [Pullulanibacillus pueri]GGH75963.1 diaminobutyrate--2-oxoglutarate transaminase [Pullulanibacillus pueri]